MKSFNQDKQEIQHHDQKPLQKETQRWTCKDEGDAIADSMTGARDNDGDAAEDHMDL